MSPLPEVTAELQRAFDAAAHLSIAGQRWVAGRLLGEVKRIAEFDASGRQVLEEIVQDLLREPQSKERFVLFRPKLRRDIPVAVSRQFYDSYRLLGSETKEAARQNLLTWMHQPSSDGLLTTPFRTNTSLSWVHFQSDVIAVLSNQEHQPLWLALLRFTRKPTSLTKGASALQKSPVLRQYLDAL